MSIESIGGALQLTALAACSVSLWTLRVAIAAAGRRVSAALIAALDDPLRIVG